MIKDILSNKRNRIIVAIICCLVIALFIFIGISIATNHKSNLYKGEDFTLVETFGKGTEFPGEVYAANGDLNIVIANESNAYFMLGEFNDQLAIGVDSVENDKGDTYQRFRVSYHDYATKAQLDAYSVEVEEGKPFAPIEEVETNDSGEGGKAFDASFTLVNVPKAIAYDIKVAVDAGGNLTLTNVSTIKNYVSPRDEEAIATITDRFGQVGFIDKNVIFDVAETAIDKFSDDRIEGMVVASYYDGSYVDIYMTESTNEQRLLDFYTADATSKTVTAGSFRVNLIEVGDELIAIFTSGPVTYMVDGLADAKAITKFIENTY